MLAQRMQMASSGRAGSNTDPYFSSVSLLLQPTSLQADGTITDFSSNAFTITKYGNATTNSTNVQFASTKSIVCDGTGDGVSAPDNTVFYLPGDFTFEAWIYPTNNSDRRIFDQWTTDGNNRFSFYLTGAGKLELVIVSGGSILLQLTGATTVSTSAMHFVIAQRSGNGWGVYLDSTTADASTTNASNPANYTSDFFIGTTPGIGSSWFGAIPAARLTKGIVRARVIPTAIFPTS